MTFAALGGSDGVVSLGSGGPTEVAGAPGRWKVPFVAARSTAGDYRASVSVTLSGGGGDVIGGGAKSFTVHDGGGAIDPAKSVLLDAYGDEANVLAGGSAADDIVFHAQLRDENGVDVDDRGTALVAVTVLGLPADTDGSSASSVSSEWTTGGRVTFKLRTNVAGVPPPSPPRFAQNPQTGQRATTTTDGSRRGTTARPSPSRPVRPARVRASSSAARPHPRRTRRRQCAR